jgi:hypothetical protein
MRRVLTLALASAAVLAATPASASLVYNANISVSAQGFGNVPRDLSLQGSGTTESGCVGVAAGGGITFGGTSCVNDATQVHDHNGVQNSGSTADMPNPLADDQKYGVPTLASLGWTSAAQIGLLFNAIEPSGNSITVNDITLKFYNSTTGALIAALDGPGIGDGGVLNVPLTFDPSQPGNGSAGFVFTVDAAESAWLDSTFFASLVAANGGAGNIQIALESTLSNSASGPESWTAFNINSPPGVPEPATWAMMLLGFGGIGFAMRRRRSSSGHLLQIA